MMRVTVEIVPFGNEDDKHTVRVVNIANTEVAPFGFRGYRYWTLGPEDVMTNDREPTGWVFHQRSDGAVELARKVLDQVRQDEVYEEGERAGKA